MRTMKQVIKPKDRAITRKLLSKAYARIKEGRSDYVCYALEGAAESEKERIISDKLQTHIHDCMGSYCFVTSWLSGQPGFHHVRDWNRKQCNEYRMAWIDQMIAQLH